MLGLVVGKPFDRDFKRERGPRHAVDERSPEDITRGCTGCMEFRLGFKKAAIWYLCGGNVAVGYGLMAAGQGGTVWSLHAVWNARPWDNSRNF